MVNATTATAGDFDKAAERHAHAFWLFLIVTGAVWWFASWGWAIIPGALALLSAIQSVGATRAAASIRDGSFPVPNPNTGAPDGDARNIVD